MGAVGDLWMKTTAWSSLIICAFIVREVLAVAVSEVRLLSNSNKSKYVLHGEGATLTCHFVLETYESVSEVEWEKDGVLVYYWSMNKPPEARDVLEGRVDLSVKSPMILSITKAHMDLQGTYTCRVRTNGKTAQNDIFLMVIVDACHEDAWKTHSDMTTCTETVNMHCVGMYPKPSPACGVYNEITGKFLNSVPFDSVNTLFNRTYEVSFNRRFTIDDWINHTDISFRCHMLVLGTTWRSGIKHQLFGDPGCKESPPGVSNGYYNLTDEKSCWGFPGEGAMAEYFCITGYELDGPSSFTCRSGKWTIDEGIIADEKKLPICRRSSHFYNSMPLDYSLSEKGKPKLIDSGFLFNKDKVTDEKNLWKCEEFQRKSCRARLHTTDGMITVFILLME